MGVAPLGRQSRSLACAVVVLGLASCTLLTNLDGLSGGAGGAKDDAGVSDGPAGADGASGSGVFTDDRLEGEFGAGTFSGTRWVGDHVELEPGKTSGDFVSRVFDSGASRLQWRTLRWGPGAPYGKPLPDRGAAETGYRASSFDMAKNVLLAHFDDSIVDTSPTANVLTGSSLGGFVPGVFGSGLSDTQQGYVHATVTSAASVFNFGTDSFSWSLWAKSTTPCPGNAVYMGIENPGTGLKPHLWLGCTPLGDAGSSGTLGDTFCSTRTTTNDCADVTGSRVLTDGTWHHMAIVKAGHAPATLSAYMDGVLQGTTQNTYANPIVFQNGVELAIGGFSLGTYPADGVFDEAAIWRRALTPDEIVALYRRGAQRLTIQVRACQEPTCASVAFVGPGGDSARAFVDPANALGPPEGLPLIETGQFAQYRVHFETDDPSRSPALYEVTLAP